ncbi:premnaspirodiene oxygenase-like [Sesamum indicum]|uniref:Premnaspirodiene oxygenase-like n=1 Tax=Sesamum indicum TaxID=4182 RepID=A0A6I9SUN1_SESIN|nr:premnaspirodiene oxygenase-like [Sesamum indicum]
MDFQFLATNITTLFLFFSVVLFIRRSWKKSKDKNEPANLPPGPPKLPIIGHAHLLGTLPFRSFKTLAKTYGDIMHLKLGEVSTIVISSPAIAKEALKTRDPMFADRPESVAAKIMWYDYVDIAFSPYNEYWRQMRKICIVELLSAKNVRSFGSIRNDEIALLMQTIRSSAGSVIDLTERIFKLTSSITCRAAYGKVCRDRDALIKLMNDSIVFAGGFMLADLFPSSKLLNVLSWNKMRLVRMRRKLDVILDDIINEHKVNLARIRSTEVSEKGDVTRRGNGELGNEDLVDVLLRLQGSGELKFPIANDNIKAVIYDMFSGATETSSSTLDWAMVELVRNPRVRAKAQAEVRQAFKDGRSIDENEVGKLKYLKLVVKEVLRLHPATPLVPRASREDSEINGYYIPAKTKVLVNNWGMGRNPNYFPNAESFEPERFESNGIDFNGANFEYLPFGAGKRMCPGMTFGLASVELPLAHLLYNFNWELPKGIKPSDLDMTENPGISAPRKHHLHIVATPYDPSP